MEELNKALFAKEGRTYFLKFAGQIRFAMAPSLDVFVDEMFKRGDFNHVDLNLQETDFIDSTGLGLLARIGRFVLAEFGHKATISCRPGDVCTLLQAVGFEQVFAFTQQTCEPNAQMQEIPHSQYTAEELSRGVVGAHHDLMALSERNRQMYKDVVRALEDELRHTARHS